MVIEFELLLQQCNVCSLQRFAASLNCGTTRAHDAGMLGLSLHQEESSDSVVPQGHGTCAKGQNHEHRNVRSLPIFGAVLAMNDNPVKLLQMVKLSSAVSKVIV